MPISSYLQNLRKKVGHDILQIPSVAAIVRNEEERILLVKTGGVWGLPAGAIDLGESPASAVAREVFEETGLRIEPLHVSGVFGGKKFRYVYNNGDAVEYFIVVFECKIAGGNLNALDGEASEIKYFAIEDFPDLAIPYPQSIFMRQSTKVYFE